MDRAERLLPPGFDARRELNIRTTTNALLAFAAGLPSVQPYLRRYFGAAVVLPSDWLDVAAFYRAHLRALGDGAYTLA